LPYLSRQDAYAKTILTVLGTAKVAVYALQGLLTGAGLHASVLWPTNLGGFSVGGGMVLPM
jgi:hypothetical protein